MKFKELFSEEGKEKHEVIEKIAELMFGLGVKVIDLSGSYKTEVLNEAHLEIDVKFFEEENL